VPVPSHSWIRFFPCDRPRSEPTQNTEENQHTWSLNIANVKCFAFVCNRDCNWLSTCCRGKVAWWRRLALRGPQPIYYLVVVVVVVVVVVKDKGKAIPLQAWTGPEGSKEVEAPRIQDNRHI
jgi:hypothetical protein